MMIDSLERATALRNYRDKAKALRHAAASSPVDFAIWHEGEKLDPFSVISAEPVRQAVIDACTDYIVEIETELRSLGVSVSKPEPEPSRDLNSWRRTCEMYARAWIRSLGGKLIPKSHLIDALVLTTEKLVKDRDAALEKAGSPKCDEVK